MAQPTIPTENIVQTLKMLIGACQSISLSFRDAADRLFSPSLKVLFSSYSLQWMRFVGDLQIELDRYDSDALDESIRNSPSLDSSPRPAENGGEIIQPAATTSNFQIIADLENVIKAGNEIAILSAFIYGENVVLDMYAAALNQDFPPQLFHLLDKQHTEIKRLQTEIGLLRDPQNLPPIEQPSHI